MRRNLVRTMLILSGGGYKKKVLGTGPFAYWPLNEFSGTTAYNYGIAGLTLNGLYKRDVSVMGIGAGAKPSESAPYFGGADGVNIYTAGLNAAFDPALGSMMIWGKIAAAEWADGTNRFLMNIGVDAVNNFVSILKAIAVNSISYWYKAGGTLESQTTGGLTTEGWQCFVMTWSVAADAVIYYLNGATTGAADNTLGAWAGALAANLCNIGAQTSTPGTPFVGYLAHTAIWDRVLSPVEIAALV
jgi:hypothetical protein